MKTVLITGATSGIGKSAVETFARAGWNVAATTRKLDTEMFAEWDNVHEYILDVTKPQTIKKAFADVQKDFGTLDVVINNAGYGVQGIFEAVDEDKIQAQFDTNVFGLMRVTRAAIEAMRPYKSGVIVQVSSMGGRLTFPLYSLYHSSKWAVEGFNEALQYELRDTGIRLRLIEPGIIKTPFYIKAADVITPKKGTGYDAFLAKISARSSGVDRTGSSPDVVARKIYKAATGTSHKLRYGVGGFAPLLLFLRKALPDRLFFFLIRKLYKL